MVSSSKIFLPILFLFSFSLPSRSDTFWEELHISTESQSDVTWKPVSSDSSETSEIEWSPISDISDSHSLDPTWIKHDIESGDYLKPPSRAKAPTSVVEASFLLNSLWPEAIDYPPLLRLGAGVPTADQVDSLQGAQLSFYQLAPMAGGGEAGGTGNQNYVGRIDLGVTDRLQISGFYSEADDNLFSAVNINGIVSNPSNFWQSYGASLQYKIPIKDDLNLAFGGSLEGWNVGSGGSLGAGLVSQLGSPNIFNDSSQRVFTKNVVGSLAFPLSWETSKNVQLTLTPGVSFLPSTQGAGQGGAGNFYGTNFTISGGAAWRPSDQLTWFTSALVPLGPGTNSFNSDLKFQRVPILTGGFNYALNPRIGLEATLTNGFGGTPATALLSLPSANQLMYSARMVWNPQAADTPQLEFTKRSRSLSLGGVSVSTALIPPASVINAWANADDKGNLFGQVGWSASNDFQFILFDAGAFSQVSPITPLVSTYANDGGLNQRFGGKAVFLQQLRGAPLTASGAITLGRNYDSSSFQGYLFAEAIGTWEANKRLALNLNPKLAWSGVETPFGIGLSANIQLGTSFQLIPEINAVATDIDSSNATLALRWLPRSTMSLDIYVSNAAGLYGMGQLLKNNSARVGTKFTIQL